MFYQSINIKNSDIIIFENNIEGSFSASQLSSFIRFLKFNKVKTPILFAYAEKGENLVPSLSIKENILQQSTNISFDSININTFLDKCGNP